MTTAAPQDDQELPPVKRSRGKRRKSRERQIEVTAYVTRTLKERVKAHAAREGRSESEVLAAALRSYFFRGSQCELVAVPPNAASCTVAPQSLIDLLYHHVIGAP